MFKCLMSARKSIYFSLLIILLFFLSCQKDVASKSYFPETGRNAIYQSSIDLRRNLKVLSISMEPGQEDLSGLAYFRLGLGAKIMGAYITNGEGGESDIRGEYPPYLAKIRREEAADVLAYLGGQVHFLNMPHIASARDSTRVRELWPADQLQAGLVELFSQFRPDVVLLARDWTRVRNNHQWERLHADLITAAKESPFVEHLFVDSDNKKGLLIPVDERHKFWKKTYRKVGKEAATKYRSLAVQRNTWLKGYEPSYHLAYTTSPQQIEEMDERLSTSPSKRLSRTDHEIRKLTDVTTQENRGDALRSLVAVLDSVSYYLTRTYDLKVREQETLLRWKKELEKLRCALLGVEVGYSISDKMLTDRQLTFFTVNKLKGVNDAGETHIYFPSANKGWIINEDVASKIPLELEKEYPLVTPKDIDYTFPPGRHEVTSSTLGEPFQFFILHQGPTKEESFIYSSTVEFTFSPKVAIEILSPIVRMTPGEIVVFRLTNISRDGVADVVRADGPLAYSNESKFRLSNKDNLHLDTLRISWTGRPDVGTYLIPLKIGYTQVGNFAARKFNAEVDKSKKVGIVGNLPNSPLANALRRLNINFSSIRLDKSFSRKIALLDVLLVDRRALSLKPQIKDLKNDMVNFVKKGGHLIVFAQDAVTWNESPLWSGMDLTPTVQYDENIELKLSSTHTLLKQPNPIASQDWNGWLYSRGYNIVSGNALENMELPVREKHSGKPLIVSLTGGKGKQTYVDLALGHQWMNIHPGAYRLLANLISN